jgi:hypothetical protein
MRRLHFTLAVAAAAVVGLGACSDSTGAKDRDSTVSFQYSGFSTGSFTASGNATNASQTHPAFAAAIRDTTDDAEPVVAIVGFQALENGRTSFIDLEFVEPSKPGDISLDDTCGTGTSHVGCGLALLAFNWDLTVDSAAAGEESYLVTGGTVHVSEISSTRVRGTFTAQAEDDNAHTITVTGGSFDVPFVSSSSLFGSRSAPRPAELAPLGNRLPRWALKPHR